MTTNIAAGSGIAVKKWSEALFAQAVKAPVPTNTLSGPAPTVDKAQNILRRQSTTGMPIVQINDLAKGAGDTVRMDCAQVVKARAVMGDANAEGKGASMKWSFQDIKIDMATLPISAGGKMSQQRFQFDLRAAALAQLAGNIPAFRWQRILTALAGARGEMDGSDWVLPLSTDPEFADQMVNTVQAPTFNRHYVVNGTDLIPGGQQLALTDPTEIFLLSHIDGLAALIDEIAIKMAPIVIPGDMAAGDDPLKGVLMVDPLVWDTLITDKTQGNNIRTWQSNALDRAAYGDMAKHPLFAGKPLLWNGILVKKMSQGVRFSAGAAVKYVAQADRYTAAESTVNVAAIGAGYQISRSLFLSAQALGMAGGANYDSGVPYSMLEHTTNYGRNLEIAGEIIGAEQKVRFAVPNETGQAEPTDFGVMVIDSVTKRRVF
jgi:hypothetical protein